MKSILWKEYLEHRYHFLILVAFGICALLVMNHYNYLDSGTILFVLFIFSCPAFALLIGMHMIAIENMRNTFPFLAMLPISRSKLWWAKVVFSLLFCGSIYFVYTVLSLIFNASVLGFDTFNFYHANLPKFPFTFIFISLPGVFLSLGLFLTMLPNIPGMIVLGIFSAGILTLLFSQEIFFFNIHLLCFFLTISFLVSSRWAFLHGEMMDSLKRTFWGLGTLIAGIFLSLTAWFGLDALCDRYYQISKWGSSFKWIFVESETSVIFPIRTAPYWWDPLQEHGMRTLRLDTRTGKFERIGGRLMRTSAISPNKRYLAAHNVFPSLRLKHNYGVVLVDLHDKNKVIQIDDNGTPLGFTEKGDLVYSRVTKGEKFSTTELCYYQVGSGTKVLEAKTSEDLWGVFLLGNSNSILYNIKKPDKRSFLINLNDFSTKRLEVRSDLLPIGSIGSSTVLFRRESERDNSENYLILNEAGELTAANWIPASVKFIGTAADGNGLGLVPSKNPPISSDSESMDLVLLDGKNKSTRTIASFNDWGSWNNCHEIDTSGLVMIARFNSDKPNVLRKVQISDGSVEKFECPFAYTDGIASFAPGRFIICVDDQIWTLDLRTMEFRKMTGV